MPATGTDDIRDIDPETATPGEVDIKRVESGLRSDNNLVRTHAAQLTTALAAEDPHTIEPLVPTLSGMFDDDRAVVLKEVLFALSLLADDDPEAVVDVASDLLGVLNHDLPIVNSAGARVLRPLAAERPDAFSDHVDELLAIVEHPVLDPLEGLEPSPNPDAVRTETVENIRGQSKRRQLAARVIVAHLLVKVTDIEPTSVSPHSDRLIALLNDDNPTVRSATAGALAALAEHQPAELDEAIPSLIDALDDVDDTVRARIIAALGHLGDDAAVDPLREVTRDEDADADLRDLAAETADFLDSQ
jgi:vesicle coat complex subunit